MWCPCMSLANTIVAAWKHGEAIDWGQMLHHAIFPAVKMLQPGKSIPLSGYLSQLYWYGDCLLSEESRERDTLRSELVVEDDSKVSSGSEDDVDMEVDAQDVSRPEPAIAEETCHSILLLRLCCLSEVSVAAHNI